MTGRLWMAMALSIGPAASAAAQGAPVRTNPNFELGVVGGTNITTYEGTSGFSTSHRAGPILGLFARWGAARPLGVQADLAFVQDGAKLAVDQTSDGFDQVRYIQLPVLARLQLFPRSSLRPYVSAGPYAGLRLGCTAGRVVGGTQVSDPCDSDQEDTFKRWDAGLMFGAGLDYNRWTLGARYQLGLQAVGPTTALLDAKNRGVGITIGYALKQW